MPFHPSIPDAALVDDATIRQSLAGLHARLIQVRQAYSLDDYQNLLQFHVRILPRLLHAERCSIFLLDPESGTIWLKFGTGLAERELTVPPIGSIAGQVIATGTRALENHLDQRTGFHTVTDAATGFVTRNLICVPLKSQAGGTTTGAVQVLNKHHQQPFDHQDLELLEEMASHLALILENLLIHQTICELEGRLAQETNALQTSSLAGSPFIIGSQAMREVTAVASMVSGLPVNVFICGENGTGKELVARLIHLKGSQGKKPFVAVNCSAIPENLIESEFFGYEKGAFTGADTSRKGRFEEAENGTLFLDEVGDMPLSIQPKFLRALQEREGTRLGSNRPIPYHFRLISATNQDLQQRVTSGHFRQDLYYRLYSVEIVIPPLRERREEIVPMTMAFLDETRRRFNKWIAGFSQEVIHLFERYDWPGNVRQLRQEVERVVALTPDGTMATAASCSEALRRFQASARPGPPSTVGTLPEEVTALEKRLIQDALRITGNNKVQAAKLLGITRQGLHQKMNRYFGPRKAPDQA